MTNQPLLELLTALQAAMDELDLAIQDLRQHIAEQNKEEPQQLELL